MNREPDETAEQWYARAAEQYQLASRALDLESRRLGLDRWQFHPGSCPVLDQAYVGALDNLVAADDERTDASHAAQREGAVPDATSRGATSAFPTTTQLVTD